MATKIGRYEIQTEVGRGGFGKVYRAFDPLMQRVVALKVLTPSDDSTNLSRFRIEATAAGNLHHRNIITIHDFGDNKGVPYLVMEYLEGEDLQKTMASGRLLTLIEKVQIMRQVADGLHCAHRNGVIHRDVKPANIMLLPDCSVKIMDFGIALLTDSAAGRQTRTGLIIGTPLYMSPERLQGAIADAAGDIWAYGVIFYELITGINPFRAPDTTSIMFRITSVEPDPIQSIVPECPEALAGIVARALSKDRDFRYHSLEDLDFDLEPIFLDLQKQHAQTLLAEANRQFDQGHWDEAQSLNRKILDLDPTNRAARQLRESIQKKIQRLAVRPRIEVFIKAGDEDFARRNFEASLRNYDAAARLDQTDTVVRYRIDKARDAIERSKNALQLLKDAREELQQQNYTGAVRWASEAVRTDPNEPQAAELLDRIRREIEKRDRERALQEGIGKARGLLLIDSFDEAIAILSELATGHPESQVVADLLCNARQEKIEREKREKLNRDLEAAKTAVRNGRFFEAAVLLKPLLAEFPKHGEISRLLSFAEEELGNQVRKRAVAEVQRHVQDLLDLGKLDESIQVLEQALGKYPAEGILVRQLEFASANRERQERDRNIDEVKLRCNQLEREGLFKEALQHAERAVREYTGDSILIEIRDRLQKSLERYERFEAIKDVLVKTERLIAARQWTQALDALERECLHYPEAEELRSARIRAASLKDEHEKRQFIENQLARARELEARQEFQSALDVIASALEQYPAEKDLIAAGERLSKALRDFESNRSLAQCCRDIERLIGEGRFSEALAAIEAARNTFPNVPVWNELSARAQLAIEAAKINEDIARRVHEIERLIAANDFTKAAQFVADAQQVHPNERRFAQVYNEAKKKLDAIRVAELQQAKTKLFEQERIQEQARAERTRKDIAERKDAIERFISRREFKQALDLIASAQGRHPTEPIFEHLLDQAKRAQAEALAVDARKDIEQRSATITQAAASANFPDAFSLIAAAQKAHPGELVFEQLLNEATQTQNRARAEQRKQEIARARTEIDHAIAAHDTGKASDLISSARREYPDQAIFNRLLEELNTQLKRKNLEESIAAVQSSLKLRDLAKARELLSRASKAYPKEERLRQLGEVLERTEKYGGCMDAARKELERSRFSAAEKAAREALKHKPDDSEAEALLKRIESERFQSEEREHRRRALLDIEKSFRDRQFDLAAEKSRQALIRFPRDPDLGKQLQMALAANQEIAKPTPTLAAPARSKWVISLISLATFSAAGIWVYEKPAKPKRVEPVIAGPAKDTLQPPLVEELKHDEEPRKEEPKNSELEAGRLREAARKRKEIEDRKKQQEEAARKQKEIEDEKNREAQARIQKESEDRRKQDEEAARKQKDIEQQKLRDAEAIQRKLNGAPKRGHFSAPFASDAAVKVLTPYPGLPIRIEPNPEMEIVERPSEANHWGYIIVKRTNPTVTETDVKWTQAGVK